MMIIAKFRGNIVQIVKVQKSVMFSTDKDWIFICFDFDKRFHKREQFKWVRAETAHFDWVREFKDSD